MHAQTWIETLNRLRAAERPCAMVVVTELTGSGPREPGARMIVALRAEGGVELIEGTIGGGRLELSAMEHAAELLQRPQPTSESVSYPLAEKTGQCCGGKVVLFYETFPWSRRRIAIFGAGHVAQALAGLGSYLSAQVQLIDAREESAIVPALPAQRDWTLLCVDHPEEEIDSLPADTLVMVMTHDHALDLEIIARAIRRDFPYLGLIGSERKWARFQARLTQRGFAPEAIAKVRCPIGLSKHSKEPKAIAISAAAEMLEVFERPRRR